jgi:hypothetical protein
MAGATGATGFGCQEGWFRHETADPGATGRNAGAPVGGRPGGHYGFRRPDVNLRSCGSAVVIVSLSVM